MEEKQFVSIEILGENRIIRKKDFQNFQPLIQKPTLNQLKTPFPQFKQDKVQLLNILLYYVISIQKNFQVYPDDQLGNKYRTYCTKTISTYYIKNHMSIQIYQFAFLISKLLSIDIQQSAHIIYYLVYGRFASHPYINSLCMKNNQDFKKKNCKKYKQITNSSKINKKKTLMNMKNGNQIQMEMFFKELKGVLKCQNSKNGIKLERKSQIDERNKHFNVDQGGNQKQIGKSNTNGSHHATQRKVLNRGYNFNTFIPQRINQGQNSSILQNLNINKQFYQSCGDWKNKKGLMRKQKFNQFFDINDIKQRSKVKKSPSSYLQQNKQNYSRNNYYLNNQKQNSNNKINYENFKNISNDLKNKNYNLDKIRYQCSLRNKNIFQKQNNQFSTFNQNLRSKSNSIFLKSCTNTFKGKQNSVKICQNKLNVNQNSSKPIQNGNKQIQNQSKSNQTIKKSQNLLKDLSFNQIKKVQKYQDNKDLEPVQLNQKIQLKKNFTMSQQCHIKDLKLSKNLSYQPIKHLQQIPIQFQFQNTYTQQYSINLLRNDQNTSQKQNSINKKMDYFSQNNQSFKKMNCKYKLQKYKSDYRKFIKTQLLDRIRQAS